MRRKKAIIIIFIILVSIVSTNRIVTADVTNYIDKEIYINNDVYTVYDLLKKKYKFPKNMYTNLNLILDREDRLTVKLNKNLYIGYIKEFEQNIQMDSGTIKAYHNWQNEIIAQQRSYNLSINTWSQSLEGIILGGEILNFKNVSLGVHAKILNGKKLTRKNYQGEILYENNKYKASGLFDSLNSAIGQQTKIDNVNFHSSGYSLGFNLSWRLQDRSKIHLAVENGLSEIKWYNIYTSVGKFDSDNLKVDQNGFNYFDSSITGNYSYNDFLSRLTTEVDLSLEYNKWKFGLFERNKLTPYINYKLIESPVVLTSGLYGDFITLNLSHKYFEGEIITKNLNFNSSTGIGANIKIKFKF
jgi:hypothetical protein